MRLAPAAFGRLIDRQTVTHPLSIPAVLQPVRHADARGYFAETYKRDRLAAHGILCDFVQDNQSLSRAPFSNCCG